MPVGCTSSHSCLCASRSRLKSASLVGSSSTRTTVRSAEPSTTRTPNSRNAVSSSLVPAAAVIGSIRKPRFARLCAAEFGVKPEARPIACRHAVNQVRGNDEAAIQQTLEGFVDLDRGEFTGKHADDGFATLSCAYARSKRAVEFAAKKDLPVLRIEADDIGSQDINRKIWREPDLAIAVRSAGGSCRP